MRRLHSLGALAAILVIVAGFAILLYARAGPLASSPTAIATTVTLPSQHYDCSPGYSSVQPIGVPAIEPHLSAVPTFTTADVIAFIEHAPNHGVDAQVVGKVTITTIAFITADQACQVMQGESIGVPNDAIVCYVALSGTFVNERVPFGVTPRPSAHAVVVFDGTSGNVLVEGIE